MSCSSAFSRRDSKLLLALVGRTERMALIFLWHSLLPDGVVVVVVAAKPPGPAHFAGYFFLIAKE